MNTILGKTKGLICGFTVISIVMLTVSVVTSDAARREWNEIASTRNAAAKPVPFRALMLGSAAFTSPTTAEFEGTGQATHLGRFTFGGVALLSPSTGSCPGGPNVPNVHTETLTAANGDELVIRMVNVACPTGPFTVQGTGHWTVLSGTGRFQDVTGQGTIRGNADFESSIFELTPDRNPLQKLDDSRRWCCGLRVTANPLHGRIFLSR